MFQNLPVEILQYVFMFLSPCTDFPNILHVCKRWRDVCLEVIKMRSNVCLSAYRLQAPLKWCAPTSARRLRNEVQVHSAPSKRFGAMLANNGKAIYLFGGATQMQTTFNDLWTFDLTSLRWKRVLGEGVLPTPRAYAKGAFIGETLYVFGGCLSFQQPGWHHSRRIECLSDLYSFNLSTLLWSRLNVNHVSSAYTGSPPVCIGQSGCFLPEGSAGVPSLLVLFGGISASRGTCVNDLCLLAPTRGQWFALTEAEHEGNVASTWPSGRWGHSVCALDAYRMLLLFGNSAFPTSPSFEPPARRQRLPPGNQSDQGESVKEYRGDPVADIWILTRNSSQSVDEWYAATWFWTKVTCVTSVPSCPPIDFEHAVILNLPYEHAKHPSVYHPTDNSDELQPQASDDYSSTGPVIYTVLCISQPTEQLLEEAARQRRGWQRQNACSSLLPRSCSQPLPYKAVTSSNLSPLSNTTPITISGSLGTNSFVSTASRVSESTSEDPVLNYSPKPSTVKPEARKPVVGRSADKRAKQLEALAIQERRLFGPRIKPTADERLANNAELAASALSNDPTFPSNPIAVYSLEIRFDKGPKSPNTSLLISSQETSFVSGHWLSARHPSYLDLLFGPQECRGYSCTFAHGCVFFFGGLGAADEPQDGTEGHSQQQQHQPINDGHAPEVIHRILAPSATPHSLNGKPSQSAVPSARTSQLYVLQPSALMGTVI